jgi:putative intracellular protease/amidase
VRRFLASEQARAALDGSIAIAQADTAAYDIVVFLGGHPALWDFLEDPLFARLAGIVYERGGIVATLGQGAAVLLTATRRDGSSFVMRARLTSASDEEEDLGGFQDLLPYYLETALRRGGAVHYRDAAHVPNVVADDRLITGQNSESAAWLARSVVEKLALLRAAK